jgi:hypothetical protein
MMGDTVGATDPAPLRKELLMLARRLAKVTAT